MTHTATPRMAVLELRSKLRAAVTSMVALSEEVARADAWSTPVPSCPGWTLHDLVAHVGGVQRWVCDVLELGTTPAAPGSMPTGASLERWLRASAAGLLTALDGDSTRPAWTFDGPGTIGFWIRRQVHEHAIHAWDAAQALDRPWSLDADMAIDGIDEVATTVMPRQVRLGRIPEPAAGLAILAGPHRWTVGNDPVATLRGEPDAVLLALWRRIDPDDARLAWHGDADSGRRLLAMPIVP